MLLSPLKGHAFFIAFYCYVRDVVSVLDDSDVFVAFVLCVASAFDTSVVYDVSVVAECVVRVVPDAFDVYVTFL